MKMKKALSILLATTIFVSSSITVYAQGIEQYNGNDVIEEAVESDIEGGLEQYEEPSETIFNDITITEDETDDKLEDAISDESLNTATLSGNRLNDLYNKVQTSSIFTDGKIGYKKYTSRISSNGNNKISFTEQIYNWQNESSTATDVYLVIFNINLDEPEKAKVTYSDQWYDTKTGSSSVTAAASFEIKLDKYSRPDSYDFHVDFAQNTETVKKNAQRWVFESLFLLERAMYNSAHISMPEIGFTSFPSAYYGDSCGISENMGWNLSDGNLIVYGEEIPSSEQSPWQEYEDSIKKVDILYGSIINDFAFSNYENLEEVNIGFSVSNIREFCFYNNKKLTSVSLPRSVSSIGFESFSSTAIKSVTLPVNLKNLGDSTFLSTELEEINVAEDAYYFSSNDGVLYDKNGKTLVRYPSGKKGNDFEIPETVEKIKTDAIFNVSSLKKVVIPASVKEIETAAMSGCSSLTTINVNESNAKYKSIDGVLLSKDGTKLLMYPGGKGGNYSVPDSVITIEEFAFFYSPIVSVSMNNVQVISDSAFDSSDSLETVYLPDTLTEIKEDAFSGDISLKNIVYAGNKEKWKTIKIDESVLDFIQKNGVKIIYSEPVETYTVTFVTNGGTPIEQQKVEKGDLVKKPGDPVKENFTFKGWYEDSLLTTPYDFSKEVVKSFTLYAKWKSEGGGTDPAQDQTLDPDGLFVVKGLEPEYIYTGKPIKPFFSVYYKGYRLVEKKEYTVSYRNNKNAGTASVFITGKGNFKGKSKALTFKIVSSSRGARTLLSISGLNHSYEYTGEPIIQENLSVKWVSHVLEEDTDYILSYCNNIDAGKATVNALGIGNYGGISSAQFTITPVDMHSKDSCFSVSLNNITYSAGGSKPIPSVTYSVNGKELALRYGVDYKAKYFNNKKLGTATIQITGQGNYSKTIIRTFKIEAGKLQDLTIATSDIKYKANQGGKYFQNKAKIYDTNGKLLKLNKDYTLQYEDVTKGFIINNTTEKNKIELGDEILVTATAVPGGLYTGEIKGTYKVVSTVNSITKAKNQKIPNQMYTDEAICPTVVMPGLTEGKDFEVACYLNNVQRGTAMVLVRGINEYCGIKVIKYGISQRSLS